MASKLLYILASPRGRDSRSIRVADAFLDAYVRRNPQVKVEKLDVFTEQLPEFTAPQAQAKYAVLAGQEPRGPTEKAWKVVVDWIDRFKSADLYLIASAMWNFSLPYRLKQLIDILVQPALTFAYSEDAGYSGLLTGRRAVLVLARGGAYAPGTEAAAYDFQKPYLEAILAFMGIQVARSILVEPTLMVKGGKENEPVEKALAEARAAAAEL